MRAELDCAGGIARALKKRTFINETSADPINMLHTRARNGLNATRGTKGESDEIFRVIVRQCAVKS